MNENSKALLSKLESAGVKFDDDKEIILSCLIRKSLKRYLDIVYSYKNITGETTVKWSIINNIYINDIRLRRELNKLLSSLEIKLRAHISNVLRGESAVLEKSNTNFSNKFLINDSILFKNFLKAKKSFRWGGRNFVSLDVMLSESNFSIIIEVYRMMKDEYFNKFEADIDNSSENREIITKLKDDMRNVIAHHGFLYTRYFKDELLVDVKKLFKLSAPNKETKERIFQLIDSIYNV